MFKNLIFLYIKIRKTSFFLIFFFKLHLFIYYSFQCIYIHKTFFLHILYNRYSIFSYLYEIIELRLIINSYLGVKFVTLISLILKIKLKSGRKSQPFIRCFSKYSATCVRSQYRSISSTSALQFHKNTRSCISCSMELICSIESVSINPIERLLLALLKFISLGI